ncbi:PatB family C-S lyase [uncultured Enterococcus sp.]|uniref:MalY/PatB family protein n=1 Tax=uncultured Enterococcus sp. TaxID=167972 RepID=UPI0028044865|nr:PatB family C-S lyase [uncultured Enterococcus sp.]
MMKVDYQFDQMADRRIDHARKWDQKIIQSKYPGTPKDCIPMWIADMDFPAAPPINEAFMKIAQNGAYGYTYAYDEFYEAVIHWHKRRHNNQVEKDWITLSYGTVSTIHYLYQAFCQPNDCVIMNTPVYDPFRYAAEHNGLNVVANSLKIVAGQYEIDYELLEEQLREKRPRIFLFCSPHNPSGRVWQLAEIEKVAQLCQQYGTIFVCDEVHSEIILSGNFVSALQLPKKYHENLIVLTSPNKGFNLGGLKTSYSIIPHEPLRRIFRHRLEMNSITSPNLFGVVGIITAYNECEDWLDAMTAYIRENYRYTQEFIEKNLPDWQLMAMTASYLPWIDISKTGKTAMEIVEPLAKIGGVIIEPGTNYASDGENFVRLNIGTPKPILVEALNRIKNFVGQNK